MTGITGIHHVAIICSDYEVSKHFYTHVLGLNILAEHYRTDRKSWKLDLALGDRYIIELFSFPFPPARVSQPEARGLRHLAFKVADIDASVAWLTQHGIKTEPIRVDEYTGKRLPSSTILTNFRWNFMNNPELVLSDYLKDFHAYFGSVGQQAPWQIVPDIESIIRKKLTTLDDSFRIHGDVAIHKLAKIEEHAIIKAPAIIGENCFIAAHVYLRGGVFLGSKAVVGPGTEIKSSIILSGTALAHFNFVGDSLVGSGVNMEAGSVIANHFNERKDKTIFIVVNGKRFAIPVQKFGAVVGDGCRIGANAVLSPGTVLAPESVVRRLELVDQDAKTSNL